MQTLEERLDARLQHLRTKFESSDDVREAQLLLTHHDELQNMSTADEDRIHALIQGETGRLLALARLSVPLGLTLLNPRCVKPQECSVMSRRPTPK